MKRFSEAFVLMEIIIVIAIIAIIMPAFISSLAFYEKKYADLNTKMEALELAQLAASDLWDINIETLAETKKDRFNDMVLKKVLMELSSGFQKVEIQIFKAKAQHQQKNPRLILDTWIPVYDKK